MAFVSHLGRIKANTQRHATGYSTPGGSAKERFDFPGSGWHCEEGAHQNTWFLSNQMLKLHQGLVSIYSV